MRALAGTRGPGPQQRRSGESRPVAARLSAGRARPQGGLLNTQGASDCYVPAVPGGPAPACVLGPGCPSSSLRGPSVTGRLAGASTWPLSIEHGKEHTRVPAPRRGGQGRPGLAALTPRVLRSAGTAPMHARPATHVQMHGLGSRAARVGRSVGARCPPVLSGSALAQSPSLATARPVRPGPWRCPGLAFAPKAHGVHTCPIVTT